MDIKQIVLSIISAGFLAWFLWVFLRPIFKAVFSLFALIFVAIFKKGVKISDFTKERAKEIPGFKVLWIVGIVITLIVPVILFTTFPILFVIPLFFFGMALIVISREKLGLRPFSRS